MWGFLVNTGRNLPLITFAVDFSEFCWILGKTEADFSELAAIISNWFR